MIQDRENFEELAGLFLENELSAEEEKEFHSLLQKYPEWKKEIPALVRIHSELEDLHLSKDKKKVFISSRNKIFYLATAALLFLGIYIGFSQFHAERENSIAMTRAEEEVLTLSPILEKKPIECSLQTVGNLQNIENPDSDCTYKTMEFTIQLKKDSLLTISEVENQKMIQLKRGKAKLHSEKKITHWNLYKAGYMLGFQKGTLVWESSSQKNAITILEGTWSAKDIQLDKTISIKRGQQFNWNENPSILTEEELTKEDF